MSAKPTIANARWADVAGVPAANVSPPSAGQRNTGYTNGQIPPSSTANSLFREFYLWCQYISDGAWTGPITVTGLLTVTTLSVTGTAAVADDLGVGGDATVAGGLTAGSVQVTTDLVVQDDALIVGEFNCADVRATGDVFRGAAHEFPIPASDFSGQWTYNQFTSGSFLGPHVASGSVSDLSRAPVRLAAGDFVNSVEFVLHPVTTSIVYRLVSVDRVTAAGAIVATGTSTGAGRQTFTLACNHTLAADKWYFLEIFANGTPADGAAMGAFIIATRPAP